MSRVRREYVLLAGVLILAGVLRMVAVSKSGDNLSTNVDAYLEIARNVAEGRGYSISELGTATAYRPPLYPLVLALLKTAGGGEMTLAVLQIVMGISTVFLTWMIGRRMKLGRAALFAAVLVAVDPLLIYYTTFPMTETLFTFLVACLLLGVTAGSARHRWTWQILVGLLFGICALCRPTIWVFGLFGCLWWIVFGRRREADGRVFSGTPWLIPVMGLATVSPWLVRNCVVLSHPVLTTTHGGYTLLLGNNPVFYKEVVNQPWGAVWDDADGVNSQAAWYRNVKADLSDELGPMEGEVKRDRWMYHRAFKNIQEQPGVFVRACWLRFRRFWNIVPMNADTSVVSPMVQWGVGLFYGCVTGMAVLGLVRIGLGKQSGWIGIILLIASFSVVHLLFWSNARMRAPIIPAIALLAASGCCNRRKCFSDGKLAGATTLGEKL